MGRFTRSDAVLLKSCLVQVITSGLRLRLWQVETVSTEQHAKALGQASHPVPSFAGCEACHISMKYLGVTVHFSMFSLH